MTTTPRFVGRHRERKVAAAFFIALAVVAVVRVASYQLTTRGAETTGQLSRNREVLSTLADVQRTVQEAETGQRGYLLTGESRYLAPYQAALERFPATMLRLEPGDRRRRRPSAARRPHP